MIMARPLSEEKRLAILEAAAEAVAEIGTSASTARISKAAGVSEGTIFTYFPTKDELLNQLYLEIKSGLGRSILGSYPTTANLHDRTRYVWDQLIEWGKANPAKSRAMKQLSVSEIISAASRKAGNAIFEQINDLLGEVATGSMAPFCGAILEVLSETTVEFMLREPANAERHKQAGFAFFWKGLQT